MAPCDQPGSSRSAASAPLGLTRFGTRRHTASRSPCGQFSHVSVTLRSSAESRLEQLRSGGWLGRRTVALKVQFTVYSPAAGLFCSVTLRAEQSPGGALLPSSSLQAASVYHTPALWDHAATICQVKRLQLPAPQADTY